ncbi:MULTISPECIES: APC family permease [unclassified Microbacterium]|uniref:APC family permease n=1 Tax=unclassified Microbacterium TaxID=2609290 RepID=UPI00214CD9E8|nr:MULTISPECIES: APC family permease [unclassified Microbacterium]MCR2784390.1 APC family permease [Microbacterium sp. zg.B96]MDL5350700.1 APC family permease [Microbacterium sp. zg-YB36]WIM14792.1 APC family permease [Microbacterium sp. zg-B96]
MGKEIAAVAPTAPIGLKRAVGTPLLFAFIVGDTLGAGIYTLVGTMANDVGGVIWLPLLIALVVALLTAGTYAELITKYPHAGGAARYVDRAFGIPYVSFLVGFLMMASGITTAAALANAFAGDYLTALIDVPPIPAAIVFIALLTLINLRGVRESLGANLVASVIEVTGLVIVIVVCAIVFGSGGGEPARIFEFAPDVPPIEGAFAASIIAFFSFLGFEAAANMAEEVRNPSKAYPRALFGAIFTAAVVYLLIAVGAVIVLPPEELAESTGPLLAVVAASGVGIPSWLFSLIALVAIANGALLFMVMASRVGYGLAEAGLLPDTFGRVLPKRRTPWVSILVIAGITMVLTVVGDISTLAETTVLLLLLVFLSANVSVLVLKKDKVDHAHFRVPRVVPVIGILACIVLLAQQSWTVWIAAAAYVAVGSVLFLIARYTRKRSDRKRAGA